MFICENYDDLEINQVNFALFRRGDKIQFDSYMRLDRRDYKSVKLFWSQFIRAGFKLNKEFNIIPLIIKDGEVLTKKWNEIINDSLYLKNHDYRFIGFSLKNLSEKQKKKLYNYILSEFLTVANKSIFDNYNYEFYFENYDGKKSAVYHGNGDGIKIDKNQIINEFVIGNGKKVEDKQI